MPFAERGRNQSAGSRLPDNSAIHLHHRFLVHKGNPKQIHDWNDLIKPRRVGHYTKPEKLRRRTLELSPAAWGLRLAPQQQRQAKAQDFVKALYKNVEVLDLRFLWLKPSHFIRDTMHQLI